MPDPFHVRTLQPIPNEILYSLFQTFTSISNMPDRRLLLNDGVLHSLLNERNNISQWIQLVSTSPIRNVFVAMFSFRRLILSTLLSTIAYTIMYGVLGPPLNFSIPGPVHSLPHVAVRTLLRCSVQSFSHIIVIGGAFQCIYQVHGRLSTQPYNSNDKCPWWKQTMLEFAGLLLTLLLPFNLALYLTHRLIPTRDTIISDILTRSVPYAIAGALVGSLGYLFQLLFISAVTTTQANVTVG